MEKAAEFFEKAADLGFDLAQVNVLVRQLKVACTAHVKMHSLFMPVDRLEHGWGWPALTWLSWPACMNNVELASLNMVELTILNMVELASKLNMVPRPFEMLGYSYRLTAIASHFSHSPNFPCASINLCLHTSYPGECDLMAYPRKYSVIFSRMHTYITQSRTQSQHNTRLYI